MKKKGKSLRKFLLLHPLSHLPSCMEKGRVTAYFQKSYGISSRESEIIEYIPSGLKNEDIADKLFISTKTVNNHIYNIFQKTDVKNRVQLVNLFITNRLP